MPPEPIDVAWDIALDDAFERRLVGSGYTTAEPDLGHSVHVDASRGAGD